MQLGGGPREVEPRVVVGEEAFVSAIALDRALLAGRQLRERFLERVDVQRPESPVELLRVGVLAHRHRPLRENRAGVEVGVHAVDRRSDLVLAVPDRPGHGHRPAMPRQERRVTVDPAERRHRERVAGNLPGETGAGDEIRANGCEERRHRGATGGDQHVEIGRQVVEHAAEVEASVPAARVANRQQCDWLVAGLAQCGGEAECDRQDAGHDHDAPGSRRNHAAMLRRRDRLFEGRDVVRHHPPAREPLLGRTP